MNHELGATAGISRAHGATGAFVSEWVINKSDFRAISGQDLININMVSNGAGGWTAASGSANSFARLCSGDLPATSAFYNSSTGLGTQSHIYIPAFAGMTNLLWHWPKLTALASGRPFFCPSLLAALVRLAWGAPLNFVA